MPRHSRNPTNRILNEHKQEPLLENHQELDWIQISWMNECGGGEKEYHGYLLPM